MTVIVERVPAIQKNPVFNLLKHIIITILVLLISTAGNAKPHCQSFNNHDNKVTIIFTDDKAGVRYAVSDVKLIPTWHRKGYKATSVSVSVNNGMETVTLTFDYLTQFSNPKVGMLLRSSR